MPSYIRDSTVAIVVYDVTSVFYSCGMFERGLSLADADSFQHTSKWIDDVRKERGDEAIIVLVGNKIDLGERRCATFVSFVLGGSRHSCSAVSTEVGKRKAKDLKVMFMETSAKEGHNVNSLFRRLASVLPGVEGQQHQRRMTDSEIDGFILMLLTLSSFAAQIEFEQSMQPRVVDVEETTSCFCVPSSCANM